MITRFNHCILTCVLLFTMMGIRSSEQTSVSDFDDPYCYYYAGKILVLLNNLYQIIKKLVTLERADCVFLD